MHVFTISPSCFSYPCALTILLLLLCLALLLLLIGSPILFYRLEKVNIQLASITGKFRLLHFVKYGVCMT